MQIMVARHGRQEGPYSIEQIRSMATQGLLTPTDYVWYEGCTAWVCLGGVPALLSPPPEWNSGTAPPMVTVTPSRAMTRDELNARKEAKTKKLLGGCLFSSIAFIAVTSCLFSAHDVKIALEKAQQEQEVQHDSQPSTIRLDVGSDIRGSEVKIEYQGRVLWTGNVKNDSEVREVKCDLHVDTRYLSVLVMHPDGWAPYKLEPWKVTEQISSSTISVSVSEYNPESALVYVDNRENLNAIKVSLGQAQRIIEPNEFAYLRFHAPQSLESKKVRLNGKLLCEHPCGSKQLLIDAVGSRRYRLRNVDYLPRGAPGGFGGKSIIEILEPHMNHVMPLKVDFFISAPKEITESGRRILLESIE